MSEKNPVVVKIEEILSASSSGIGNETLAAAMEKNKKEKAEKLANALADILDLCDNCINQHVRSLKEVRRIAKVHKQELNEVVRAVEYAKATGNVLPLHNYVNVNKVTCLLTGLDTSNMDLYRVPKDWNPVVESAE